MFKGEVLREARERAGYTLVGLAEALREEYGGLVVDYTTLSQWEITPTSAPRKGNIKKVADFLNICLSDLYGEVAIGYENESDMLDLIEKMIKFYKKNPNDKRIEKIRMILS